MLWSLLLDRPTTRVIERSRVRVSPTALSSTAVDKPLMHLTLFHHAVYRVAKTCERLPNYQNIVLNYMKAW